MKPAAAIVDVSSEPVTPPAPASKTSKSANRRPVFISGTWFVENDELHQTSKAQSAILMFGERDYKDFDFACDIWHSTEDVGISSMVQATDSRNYVYAEYGGYNNSYIDLQNFRAPAFHRLGILRRGVATEKWVPVCVRVRGHSIDVFVDEQLALHGQRNPADSLDGYIGLRTFNGGARFRNVKVTDADGNVLWEGFPDLPPKADN